MTYRVARPFKTTDRRFWVDQVVSYTDISGPMALDQWVDRGFVVFFFPPVPVPATPV